MGNSNFFRLFIVHCIVCVLLLSFFNLYAQQNNSLEKGSWALQFQISHNFTLSSFQGSIISAKRHFSKKRALRFGVSLNASISDIDENAASFDSDTLQTLQDNQSNRDFESINVTTQYLVYPTPNDRLSLFFGAGPIFGFSHNKSETERQIQNRINTTLKSIDKTNQWSLGIDMVLGSEWFIKKNISLLAEYGASLKYDWKKTTKTTITEDRATATKSKINSINLNANSVKFGLSIYF